MGGNAPHGGVPGVRHIDIARRVNGDALGVAEPGGAALAVHQARLAGHAGQGAHHALGRDLADDAVAPVGHVNIRRGVDRHGKRLREARVRRGTVDGAGLSGHPRQRSHDAIWTDSANHMIPMVGDDDVPSRVHSYTPGIRKDGGTAGAVLVSAPPRMPRQRRDRPVRRELADYLIGAVGDEHIARGVGGHGGGEAEPRLPPRPIHAAQLRCAPG